MYAPGIALTRNDDAPEPIKLRTSVLGSCLSQVQNGTSTSPTGLRSSSNGCGSVLTACCSNR